MDSDPIVNEVRMVRRKLFRHCDHNLDQLIAFVEKSTDRGHDRQRYIQAPVQRRRQHHVGLHDSRQRRLQRK